MNKPSHETRKTRVAILGSGPAGATLASLLAGRDGIDVALFSGGKRPERIVGESLVPAIIPLLRRLGIEDEVAAVSRIKPGATFVWQEDAPLPLTFRTVEGILPTYAYNVPRPAFDRILEDRARRSGVHWVDCEARVERAQPGSGREVQLGGTCREAVPEWGGEPPDLLVDATGRRRMFARLLGIHAKEGPRRDLALFAHYDGWKHDGPDGQIIISRRRDTGWNWQIPLKDCMSVGAVMDAGMAMDLGGSPEERLERAIEKEPLMARAGRERRRLSGVSVYTNYQLISERGAGPGWVAAGDAFGFVDPMLSPGLWVAMHGADRLARAIPPWNAGPVPAACFSGYEQGMKQLLEAWQALIRRFYDGSIMASHAAGQAFQHRLPGWPGRMLQRHIQRQFAGMACGAYTERPYSRRLMDFLCSHTYGFTPADYAIA